MISITTRTKEFIQPLLYKDDDKSLNTIMYVCTTEINQGPWQNCTIISADRINREFIKTHGHYHQENASDETYKVLQGKGVFVLQKKFISDGKWDQGRVKEVFFVEAEEGDEIIVKPHWAHSWSNVGKSPLIVLDNWEDGHAPDDYAPIIKYKGMAYYLVEDKGNITYIPNNNYKDLPQPRFISAKDFAINNY